MEARLKKIHIASLVFTMLSFAFFIGTVFFYIGLFAVNSGSNSSNDYQIGDGITAVLMAFFFLLSLIPTLCFALAGIGFCIYPLKNKYYFKSNIFKLVLNIFVIVVCIILVLILILRK